jgi:diadenosine tetraphosphate (Ap4A) HIT family hydrolase
MRKIDKEAALALLALDREALSPRFGGCMMCAIALGDVGRELVVRESARSICSLDAFASRPGHLLVISKRHVETMRATPWDLQADMNRLAWEAARVLEDRGALRVYVAQLGSARDRPNTYAHAHLHVVPLDEAGESARPASVFSWSSGIWVFEEGEGEARALELAGHWRAAVERREPARARLSSRPRSGRR